MRYVGKTIKSLRSRLRRHLREYDGSYRANWVRSAVDVQMHLVAEVEGDGSAQEVELIAGLRRLGARLVNTTDGGDSGCLGYKHSETTRARMREIAIARISAYSPEKKAAIAAKMGASKKGVRYSAAVRERMGNSRRGLKHSAEARANMSAAKKGLPKSPEWRAKIADSLRGRKLSPERRAALVAHVKRLPEERILEAIRLVDTGLSIRAAQRAAGLNKMAIANWKKQKRVQSAGTSAQVPTDCPEAP